MAPSWRAVIVVAACVKVEALTLPRRRFCAAAAGAVVAPATGANAKDLYYTKKDYCEKSDRETKNGVEFGCEAFVTDETKRLKMRRRALSALSAASTKLSSYEDLEMTAQNGAKVRAALRKAPLDGLRAQGKRLSTLTTTSDVGLAFDDCIKAVEGFDVRARRLEIDESAAARAAAAADLRAAQAALRKLVSVGSESDLLPPTDIPPPAGPHESGHMIPDV